MYEKDPRSVQAAAKDGARNQSDSRGLHHIIIDSIHICKEN